MTVGMELTALTGIPLFHNHLSIEAVLPVFDFGTEPFNRLVSEFRDRMFVEAAESELPGLIFTYVWAFDQQEDQDFIEKQKVVFESRGGRVVFVELWADLETRLARNKTEPRLSEKPSKRDVEESGKRLLALDQEWVMVSKGAFPFPDHIRIDNSQLSPRAVAGRIIEHFNIPITS